jgi:hypothetical protein
LTPPPDRHLDRRLGPGSHPKHADQAFFPPPIAKDGPAAFSADHDTNDSVAEIELSTEPIQGGAGATYGRFTIVHGSAAADVTVYLRADNTGPPSCTVQATISPTSH